MLPLPNLDDRMFEKIIEDARKSIPKLNPEWTDENAHDPGITLLELFSWLTELQQYYMDRITVKNELKYLKLLGIQLKEAHPARVDVSFFQNELDNNVDQGVQTIIPQGTKIVAKDQMFETEAEMLFIPAQLELVMVLAHAETVDYTTSNSNDGATYYAFGEEANRDSRLYMAFDQELPKNAPFSLTFSLFEDYPVPLGSSEKGLIEIIPSAKVTWYFYGQNEDGSEGWLPINIHHDETAHLSFSGRTTMSILEEMRSTVLHPANDKPRYWICCHLAEEGYEIPPKIRKITLNTTVATQCHTYSYSELFSELDEENRTLVLKHFLQLYGRLIVQVQEDGQGWRDWNAMDDLSRAKAGERVYQTEVDTDKKEKRLTFDDDNHGIRSTDNSHIRVLAYDPAFEYDRWLGQSNGLPFQSFEIPSATNDRHIQQLSIQVGTVSNTGEWLWHDWSRVDDFDQSKSDDRHYMLNPETNEISFGNHERGMIPEKSEVDNIRIAALQFGGGERGNINNHVIEEMTSLNPEYERFGVTNYFYGTGGRGRESVDDAKNRVLLELNEPSRTVTSDDFESIAQGTPGLRVARVQAIPLYVAGMKNYPDEKAHGQITVVVVPYCHAERPIPSQGFLDTVKHHLDKHRLITTDIRVISPEYIKVSVYTVVVVEPYFNDKGAINKTLQEFLQPLDEEGRRGWAFGRTVYKGDIMGEINHLPGIVYIQDLWLNAEGNGMRKQGNGDVEIPPHGLVYSGGHEVTIVSRTDI